MANFARTSIGYRVPLPEGVTVRRGQPEDLPAITKLSVELDYLMGGDYMPGENRLFDVWGLYARRVQTI